MDEPVTVEGDLSSDNRGLGLMGDEGGACRTFVSTLTAFLSKYGGGIVFCLSLDGVGISTLISRFRFPSVFADSHASEA